MELFKRVLLSLFPDGLQQEHMNPAAMFVGFVSAKQFFSVINRKIVENYKLNLFDVSLDPFEVKIGFGERPAIGVKEVDFYYGYCATANINGYRMLNPANVANSACIVSSMYVYRSFVKHDVIYFFMFLSCVYLLHFLFAAKLKVFPGKTTEENYNWFVTLFFSFYELMLKQHVEDFDPAVLQAIKLDVLQHSAVFKLLFYHYELMGQVFALGDGDDQEFYHWLFYDEIRKQDYHVVINDFLSHRRSFVVSTSFSAVEQKLRDLIFPADVLVKYLFEDDIYDVITHVLWRVMDKERLDDIVQSFLRDGSRLEEFVLMMTSHAQYQQKFFAAAQHYFAHLRHRGGLRAQEDIDEFLSVIGNVQDMSEVSVPDSIKKQSYMMEKLMNFYITYVGGFWVGRGDNFFVRLFRRPVIDHLLTHYSTGHAHEQEALYYYGNLLYNYSKNVFYYTYAFEHIRAGKDKFHLPFRATFKEVYSNMFLLHVFDEHFLITLLQDINRKDMKIYVKQQAILTLFQKLFGKHISSLVRLADDDLLAAVYGPLDQLLGQDGFWVQTVQKYFHKEDVMHLKDNLYTMNFWLFREFCEALAPLVVALRTQYSLLPLAGILAMFKETLFGALLFFVTMRTGQKTRTKAAASFPIFIDLYLSDVIGLNTEGVALIRPVFLDFLDRYAQVCATWAGLDDNKRFVTIGVRNRLSFVKGKPVASMTQDILGEDIIWLRGYLKNITYYNNRFLVPKGQ